MHIIMTCADRCTPADYEEDPIETPVAAAPSNGDLTVEKKEEKVGGSYVGVHSTGFRDFLLKPELLRAISDLGFEHPSEGTFPAPSKACTWVLTMLFVYSPTGMHSSSHPRHGRLVPGQIWNGSVLFAP